MADYAGAGLSDSGGDHQLMPGDRRLNARGFAADGPRRYEWAHDSAEANLCPPTSELGKSDYVNVSGSNYALSNRVAADASSNCQNSRSPKLLERVRDGLAMRHYSPRTAEAYLTWIRRFILFHNRRHPAQMGAAEVSRFLSSLAVKGRVSASTQNQALAAILFLYSKVLAQDIGSIENFVRAKKPLRLPVVMTRDEVSLVLSKLKGLPLLMASLLYGSGLRLSECLCLRIKDLDFSNNQIDVPNRDSS